VEPWSARGDVRRAEFHDRGKGAQMSRDPARRPDAPDAPPIHPSVEASRPSRPPRTRSLRVSLSLGQCMACVAYENVTMSGCPVGPSETLSLLRLKRWECLANDDQNVDKYLSQSAEPHEWGWHVSINHSMPSTRVSVCVPNKVGQANPNTPVPSAPSIRSLGLDPSGPPQAQPRPHHSVHRRIHKYPFFHLSLGLRLHASGARARSPVHKHREMPTLVTCDGDLGAGAMHTGISASSRVRGHRAAGGETRGTPEHVTTASWEMATEWGRWR
jgi:hypothetical protein